MGKNGQTDGGTDGLRLHFISIFTFIFIFACVAAASAVRITHPSVSWMSIAAGCGDSDSRRHCGQAPGPACPSISTDGHSIRDSSRCSVLSRGELFTLSAADKD